MADATTGRPLILFAPGAGAPSSSAWMKAWAARLMVLGDVVTFDYPYMRQGRGRPDPQPALIAAHRAALADACRGRAPGRVILAGKSMGSRIGCHVSLEERVDCLVCFGYPLRSGTTGALRDQVLLALRTPILFVQGTRDGLCPLDLLEPVRARMTARSELHVVEAGDHSLQVTKRQLAAVGETQETVDARMLDAVSRFARSI